MKARRFRTLILILLAACGSENTDAPAADSAQAPPPAGEARAPADDTATPEGVIRAYYAAIEAREFRRAYLLWGDSGRSSRQTFEQFRAGFAHTASVRVDVGAPGRMEGAAGSRYVVVPVEIEAVTDAGTTQRFSGTYTLRRSVVDGATDAQSRWHLYDAEIAACASDCGASSDSTS